MRSDLRPARTAACISLLFLTASFWQVSAQSVATEQHEALRGLKGVYVLGADVNTNTEPISFTKKILLTDIELALLKAGIPVLNEEKWIRTDGSPALYLDVTTARGDDTCYGYAIRLELQELVNPLSNLEVTTYGVVWSRSNIGVIAGEDLHHLRDVVGELTEHFVRDYLVANGRAKMQ